MAKVKNIKKVLIIGIGGGLARLTAGLLLKHNPKLHIIGVDSRPLKSNDDLNASLFKGKLKFIQMNYTRGKFESLFRENDLDAILHLGRLSHTEIERSSLSERLDLNIMGTNRILELSLKHGIKKVLVLSTYHVYGALNDNPVYLNEEYPLRASFKYPELRDVVEMDQIATNWMWKHQKNIKTIVLRPCNIIGPQISNTMTRYLRTPYVPVPIDYNPMFQFIHEFDMARIILKSLDSLQTGVYNVCTDETLSLWDVKKAMSIPFVPVPLSLLSPMLKSLKWGWSYPDYLIDYLKFSSIIDNSEIKKHLPENFFHYSTEDTLEQIRYHQSLE